MITSATVPAPKETTAAGSGPMSFPSAELIGAWAAKPAPTASVSTMAVPLSTARRLAAGGHAMARRGAAAERLAGGGVERVHALGVEPQLDRLAPPHTHPPVEDGQEARALVVGQQPPVVLPGRIGGGLHRLGGRARRVEPERGVHLVAQVLDV